MDESPPSGAIWAASTGVGVGDGRADADIDYEGIEYMILSILAVSG